MLKEGNENKTECFILRKLPRMKVKEDFENFRLQQFREAAEKKTTLKCEEALMLYRSATSALKYEDRTREENKKEMENICKNFCTNLFKLCTSIPQPVTFKKSESISTVPISELKEAAYQTKDDKARGKNGIASEHIKARELFLWKAPAQRFNEYLELGRIPSVWKRSM